MAEIGAHTGELTHVRLSDEARSVLLDLYARALVGRGRPLGERDVATVAAEDWELTVRFTRGAGTTIVSPAGRLELHDLTLAVEPAEYRRRETG